MTYVLGTATVASAPLRLQNTMPGDSLASLGRAYGVSDLAIWQMQPEARGKSMIVQNVEPFVRSRPGWTVVDGLFPFKSGGKPNNPSAFGVGVPGQGFAHFNAATQLMLPDMPRLDGKVPRGAPVAPSAPPVIEEVLEAGSGMGPAIIGFGLLTLLVLFSGKKESRKPAASSGITKWST